MKMSIAALIALLGWIASVASMGLLLPASTAHAQPELPGMCNGRSDANVSVNAHANGRPNGVPKYILNIATDEEGNPYGVLILGRGRDRLIVEDFCRLWQHLPGQPVGPCGREEDIGVTNVHAVGITMLPDGQEVLVRTDVRENDEGMFFRVRYRALEDHGEGEEGEEDGCEDGEGGCGDGGGGGGHDGGGCEDDGWTRVPPEGWHPLRQLNAHGG
jgi:hypothetical protein